MIMNIKNSRVWFQIFQGIVYKYNSDCSKNFEKVRFFIQVLMIRNPSTGLWTGKGGSKLVGFIHEEYYVTYSGSYWLTDCFKFLRNHQSLFAPKTRCTERSSPRSAQINSLQKRNPIRSPKPADYPSGIDPYALCISRFDGDFWYRHRPRSCSLVDVIIPQAW